MSEVFKDKIVLITGATRGIGAAIAHQFAEQGATVVGTATSEKGAQAISSTLEVEGYKGRGVVMNVADPESISSALEEITKQIGTPQILVNNAGITRDNLFLRMKDEEWSSILETNLTGVYRLSRACIKAMIKARFGRIINISSVVGLTGNPGQTNYAAAKAGLIGFSKSLAQEIGTRGITVNVVAPGFIDTDMTKELPEAQREKLLDSIPMGKLGSGEDIAEAVCFLASEKAQYITGETLHVNGGMYMP